MTYAQIQAEVNKADALLNTAADLIKSGHIVSIASLNETVNNICCLIKEEGYAHCRTFKPVLIHLSNQMDQIRTVMEKQLETYTTKG